MVYDIFFSWFFVILNFKGRVVPVQAKTWDLFIVAGKLVDNCTKDCLFSAEYHSGQLALRDRTGAYLSPIGSKAVLKTRSQTVTKDELFSLEDSLPQASFVAALNNKFVSVKQGRIYFNLSFCSAKNINGGVILKNQINNVKGSKMWTLLEQVHKGDCTSRYATLRVI